MMCLIVNTIRVYIITYIIISMDVIYMLYT